MKIILTTENDVVKMSSMTKRLSEKGSDPLQRVSPLFQQAAKCADDTGKRNPSTHFLTCTLILFLSLSLCLGWLKCLRRLNHGGAVATTALDANSNCGDRQDDPKFTESQQSIPHERI
jgi:hypothetical protein